jgi:hypothetical protein
MGGTRRRRLAPALLALALLSAGCTYEDREPGLFGRTPAGEGASDAPADPPPSIGPIPVLGEATWVSPEEGIPARIAVHGVRRVPGGTVLDWSITALSGPDRVPGEAIPGGLSTDFGEEAGVALVDKPAGRVYRPLATRDGSPCLCASVRLAQQDLAYDVPRLLQVAFPALPAGTRVVDVSIALTPAVTRVPVAPLGEVSAPINDSDLATPVEASPPLVRSEALRLPGGQRFAVEVGAVLASGTVTSVVWTLEALTAGAGPGPGLQPALTRNGAWQVRPLRTQTRSDDEPRCLCSDPSGWRDHLRAPGRRVTVVTTLSEIPRGLTTVDALFPGLPPLTGIRVRPASDASFRSAGTVRTPRQTWTARPNRPRRGWSLSSWPTPVPVIPAGRVIATVDRILE